MSNRYFIAIACVVFLPLSLVGQSNKQIHQIENFRISKHKATHLRAVQRPGKEIDKSSFRNVNNNYFVSPQKIPKGSPFDKKTAITLFLPA